MFLIILSVHFYLIKTYFICNYYFEILQKCNFNKIFETYFSIYVPTSIEIGLTICFLHTLNLEFDVKIVNPTKILTNIIIIKKIVTYNFSIVC